MIGFNEVIISIVGISTVIGILFSIQRRNNWIGQDLSVVD
jgi:hypothetical protein